MNKLIALLTCLLLTVAVSKLEAAAQNANLPSTNQSVSYASGDLFSGKEGKKKKDNKKKKAIKKKQRKTIRQKIRQREIKKIPIHKTLQHQSKSLFRH